MSFFLIRDKIDRSLVRAFNAASDLEFFVNRRRSSALQRNSSLKDVHKAERCFILATGPSLNNISEDQSARLTHERTFAINSFFKSELANQISPDYYVLMDNHYWGALSGDFERIAQKFAPSPPTFITDLRARSFVPSSTKSYFVHAKNYPTDLMRTDLTGNLSITMNVTGTAILSAIYMGFSKIYLMGLDHSLFANLKNNHCYEDSLDDVELPTYNLAFYLKYYHLTTEFHYRIAKTARSMGIEICNLSEGSLLDAYPIRPISHAI